jgi:hypothetical protein
MLLLLSLKKSRHTANPSHILLDRTTISTSQTQTQFDSQAISLPAPSIASHDSGSTMVTDPASGSPICRMDALQAKMNKIRAEKPRLAKLQDLEEAEAEVQREIMEERRRQMEGR